MMKIRMVLLPFLLTSVGVFGFERKLTLTVNPDCGDKCRDVSRSLIYVKAVGPNDTVHHIWDFFGKPTVFLALTPLDTNLTINWSKFLQDKGNSLQFTSEPEYVFASVIDEIVEFNDVNSTATYLPPFEEKRVVPAESLVWTLTNHTNSKDKSSAVFQGTDASGAPGHVIVKLSAYSSPGHASDTPHLHHSANTTEVDLALDHLPTTFNHSRYAFQFGIFFTNKDSELNLVATRTLDDEHAPGVFDMVEALTTSKENFNGYLQWRDVAYTTPAVKPVFQESTSTHYSPATPVGDYSKFKNSTVFAYFDERLNQTSSRLISVSYGSDGDGFYTKSGYLRWTFLSGIGRPLEDSFSLLVWLIVGIGFGLTAILIVISIGFIISRRVSTTRDSLLAF